MTNLLNRIFISPLSALTFITVFALAGDVLIATVAAIAVAFAQIVMVLSSDRRPDAVLLLSAALVLALAALSLTGQDASAAAAWSPVSAACEASHCACAVPFFAI